MADLATLEDPAPEQNDLSRRERERLRRRRAMLRAAQAVFAEKGYAQATLDEIAARAEFGKGTLYNYFEGGKEEIFFALFDHIYNDLFNLYQEAFSSEETVDRSFRAAFRSFVSSFSAFFLERQELFMMLLKEQHRMIFSDESEKAAYFRKHEERLAGALVPSIEAAMDTGELQRLPPQAVAHTIRGNVTGLLVHTYLKESLNESESLNEHAGSSKASHLHMPGEAADFLTTMLFDGLAAA